VKVISEIRFETRDQMIPFPGPINRGQVDHYPRILLRTRDVHRIWYSTQEPAQQEFIAMAYEFYRYKLRACLTEPLKLWHP
jgi:hypothetical protein